MSFKKLRWLWTSSAWLLKGNGFLQWRKYFLKLSNRCFLSTLCFFYKTLVTRSFLLTIVYRSGDRRLSSSSKDPRSIKRNRSRWWTTDSSACFADFKNLDQIRAVWAKRSRNMRKGSRKSPAFLAAVFLSVAYFLTVQGIPRRNDAIWKRVPSPCHLTFSRFLHFIYSLFDSRRFFFLNEI